MRPRQRPKQYAVNESFFEKIDSEAKAYWLGFVTADGSIQKSGIAIGLAGRDVGHLRKFAEAIGYDGPIREAIRTNSYGKTSCRIAIVRMRIASDLASHGVLPNKTFSVRPAVLSSDLERHYWRGVVDGDGSIIVKDSEVGISLIGNREIVDGFNGWASRVAGLTISIYPKGRVFQAQCRGALVGGRLIWHLYRDCSVYLDRKMERARVAINRIRLRASTLKVQMDALVRDGLIG